MTEPEDGPAREDVRFDGQVAIVTGAGKGLGRSYAYELARRGASVVVNSRRHPDADQQPAQRVVDDMVARGGSAVADFESVEDPEAGERMVDNALSAFGRLDIVVANAGISEPRFFHKSSVAQIQHMIAVNLWGSMGVTRAALPHLREQGSGRILVTTSSAALYGDIGFASYAATKAGLIGFALALAHECESVGVKANAVLPFALTSMTTGVFESDAFPAGTSQAMDPASVTGLVVWLLGDSCESNGGVWIVAGRVVRRAVTMVTRGLAFEDPVLTPELLTGSARGLAELGAPYATFDTGADLLRDLANESLGS